MVATATRNSIAQAFGTECESGAFTIFVQHHGRWIRGCQFDSVDAASTQAADSFRRSGLDVEVRDASGEVRFRQNSLQRAACLV